MISIRTFHHPPLGSAALHPHALNGAALHLQGPDLRLAIASHLSINDATVVPIISAIRSTYPSGPLAIAQDLDVWDISPTNVTQRK